MSIIISGIKLDFNDSEEQAVRSALKILKVGKNNIISVDIYKKSLDLRKNHASKVYSVLIKAENEGKIVKKLGRNDVKLIANRVEPEILGEKPMEFRPVVVGFGPCGMFAALLLAKKGYRPIVIERGENMAERDRITEHFFATGKLDRETNVQFGEGGAGTYSDGKLTTRTHDSRGRLVLEYLFEHGAPKEVLTAAKPHIGTDLLKNIVVSIRKEINSLGGEVLFSTKMEDIKVKNGKVSAIVTNKGEIYTDNVILAIGHSARDTYNILRENKIDLVQKSFAVGVRVEHKQEIIDQGLYGDFLGKFDLPKGEYNLANTENGRGCYTFCMCPGGKVVACASEEGGSVTNGMSYHARDGENANSALVVTVNPEDYGNDLLAGIEFQRNLERLAFKKAGGDYKAPLQLYKDFKENRVSQKLGSIEPTYNRGFEFCDLNEILPQFICEEMKKSMDIFGKKIKSFDGDDVVMTGVETRTSSPLRIVRDENMESIGIKGLYPSGEGAGYAGGIMSAAVDGIKAAERIMAEYLPYSGV